MLAAIVTLYLAMLVGLSVCRLVRTSFKECQTTQKKRKRHLGQTGEIRSKANGLGRHLLDNHGQGLNLKNERVFEEEIQKHFKLRIIASVQHNST